MKESNKNLLLSLLLSFFSAIMGYGQFLNICHHSDYISTNKYINEYGLSTQIQNNTIEIFLNDLLIDLGLDRNFVWKEHQIDNRILTVTIDPYFGTLERYVAYPKIISTEKRNKKWPFLGLILHSIGHHIGEDILLKGMENSEKELKADWFSGYVLAKLGATEKQTLSQFNYLEDFMTYPNYFPNVESRKKAVLEGRKDFFNGIIWTKEQQSVVLKPFNYDLIKSYEKIVKTIGNNDNYDILANAWLNIYINSNGQNREALYYASYYFTSAKSCSKGLVYARELLKKGINFLSKKAQNSIFKIIGKNLYCLQKVKESIPYLKIAVELDAKDIESLDLLSKIAGLEKKWVLQAEYLKEMIKIKPSFLLLYKDLGNALSQSGRPSEAIKYYKRALYIDPKFVLIRLNLASIYMDLADDLNDKNKSLNIYEIKANKKTIEELYQSALKVLEEGLITNPDSEAIRNAIKRVQGIVKS